MPLTTWQWMWRSSSNQCGCHNKPDHCFMGNKSAPAVNILALAVTLFGAFSYLKTAPCVCRMTTLWTIHHIQIPTFAIRIIVMIHKISILRTFYSISRSSIFTSSSILVVKPLTDQIRHTGQRAASPVDQMPVLAAPCLRRPVHRAVPPEDS